MKTLEKHIGIIRYFWDSPVSCDVIARAEDIEETAALLKAKNVLWTYRDGAIAFAEEAFSDYFAALYDLETGGCCCVEYDS